jgi:hypothetical protein
MFLLEKTGYRRASLLKFRKFSSDAKSSSHLRPDSTFSMKAIMVAR